MEIADAIIVIPEDFEERVVNKEKAVEVYRDERKIESFQIQHQINKFISFVNATYENGELDLNAVNLALKEKANVEIVGTNNGNEKVKEWFFYYFNFTAYVIIAIYIAVIGMVMTDFTEDSIESRRRVSSKKNFKFNKEIYLGNLYSSHNNFITRQYYLQGNILRSSIYKYNNTIVFSFTILSLTF